MYSKINCCFGSWLGRSLEGLQVFVSRCSQTIINIHSSDRIANKPNNGRVSREPLPRATARANKKKMWLTVWEEESFTKQALQSVRCCWAPVRGALSSLLYDDDDDDDDSRRSGRRGRWLKNTWERVMEQDMWTASTADSQNCRNPGRKIGWWWWWWEVQLGHTSFLSNKQEP